jgi:hypothetical protein
MKNPAAGRVFVQAAFFLLSVSCGARAAASMEATTGETHNRGVAYVLEHMKTVPPKADLDSKVLSLTLKYCKSAGLDCPGKITIPQFPLQDDLIVAASGGSAALQREFKSLLTTVRTAKDIPSLEVDLKNLEQQADTVLKRPERKRFADAVSVAISSARLWAPVALGGRGGDHIRLPPGGKPVADIDWGEVAEVDLEGCMEFFLEGCIEGAVAFSAVDILIQLYTNE